MNVGIVQMEPVALDAARNLSRAEKLLSAVVLEGAKLVVLPEMFNVGFYFGESLMAVAEPLDGPTVAWLKKMAAEHHVYITCSFYESFEGYFYNTMVMVGYDGSLQYYRKRNPTWQERLVWRRADEPGPGIFDTPFGRVGGVICFDSFARETFLGFQKSRVDLVVVIACWGRPRLTKKRPDLLLGASIMKKWSHIAAEIVPRQYARHLSVPVVFVNNAGVTRTPAAFPRPHFWPFAELEYAFYGRSYACDRSGQVKTRAWKSDIDYWGVADLDIEPEEKDRPAASRTEVPLDYLDSHYYFVQPPYLAKVFQKWCFRGFHAEYEARCRRHQSGFSPAGMPDLSLADPI